MADRMRAAWDDPELRYTWIITMSALGVLVAVNRGFRTV